MKPPIINPGDSVRLKSGGPTMTALRQTGQATDTVSVARESLFAEIDLKKVGR